SHLDDALVGLAGAEDAVVLPDRNAAPLPLLDDSGIGFLDEGANAGERLAAPVAELLDSCVDQAGRRLRCVGLLARSSGSHALHASIAGDSSHASGGCRGRPLMSAVFSGFRRTPACLRATRRSQAAGPRTLSRQDRGAPPPRGEAIHRAI